jgi:uncharacterized protein YwgA
MKEALSFFTNLPYTLYLVSKMREIKPHKQIGKTMVQKMLFLFSRQARVDFDYTLYHYGPFSLEIASDIEIGEKFNLLDVKWNSDSGFNISAKLDVKNLKEFISKDERKKLDSVVNEFADYNATDLSLVTTAFYIKDNFGTDDRNLAESVNAIKPNYDLDRIKRVLHNAKILP